MKYLNAAVFAGLMVFVVGCQKQQDTEGVKKSEKQVFKKTQKQKIARRGPTQLETKKSAARKKAYADRILQKQQG